MPNLPHRLRTGLLASAVAAVLALTAAVPATAVPGPDVRFVAHLDIADGQRPENITLEPGGSVVVTFAYNRQVARISPQGKVRVLATLPQPPAGSTTPALTQPFLGGVVRTDDGTLYFVYATGSADLTGVWRLRPGGTPHRIAALPATALPNGLTLDREEHRLYIADSVLGTVWRVPVTGGIPTRWSTAPELAADGFLGANGIKTHDGAVWVSNLDKGTVVRIPVTRHGTVGRVETRAEGLANIDDFAFTGRGDTLLAAINADNEVALIRPDGTHTTVLTDTDGIENPTSLAVRGTTAYVASGAYFTNDDPNLLAARVFPHK
ncbi:hypothetical protein [Streptomyces canus]|uniref:hypothetical protein n=1 Tax=Streptomyces canus TaxID=58343 RepID=UPI0027814669|nr:hypothetical protein [Streptomyces canus]MDQ0767061.1 sugar lactone lactonase YvrE [Streptomyces canus]